MTAPNRLIGSPMERVEDLRLLRGRGAFVADISRAGQLHAVILRSSVAHGILQNIDTSPVRISKTRGKQRSGAVLY